MDRIHDLVKCSPGVLDQYVSIGASETFTYFLKLLTSMTERISMILWNPWLVQRRINISSLQFQLLHTWDERMI